MVSCCMNAETDNSCCRSPVILPTAYHGGRIARFPFFSPPWRSGSGTETITFSSAHEMLDTLGMQQGGSQYRRLIGAFQRIFGATIFFGSDMQLEKSAVVHHARFNFMNEARIWYSRDPGQQNLPGDCQNMIVLSEEFYQEIQSHPIPADLESAKALSSSPAVLDLYMWLSYRCFAARGEERVPLFGDFGPHMPDLGSSGSDWKGGWSWCA